MLSPKSSTLFLAFHIYLYFHVEIQFLEAKLMPELKRTDCFRAKGCICGSSLKDSPGGPHLQAFMPLCSLFLEEAGWCDSLLVSRAPAEAMTSHF